MHARGERRRFLLTQESRVPDAVKAEYLKTPVTGTVVSTHIDGYPQRVIRTKFVDHLEHTGRLMAYPRAAINALKFQRLTGTKTKDLLTEGKAMHDNQGLAWHQVALAANAPMLTKATLVDGDVEVGILPTGHPDLRRQTLPEAWPPDVHPLRKDAVIPGMAAAAAAPEEAR